MKRRLVFVCNAFDDVTRTSRGIITDSPAASKKIVELCKALSLHDVRPVVLSMGRGGRASGWKIYKSKLLRVDGVAFIYTPFATAPVFSELLSIAGLMYAILNLRLKGIKHILFYNRTNAFLPPLLLSSLLGCSNILDFEDGEILEEKGIFKAMITRAVSRIFDTCCERALLACSQLKGKTSIGKIFCYYGAVFNISNINKFQSGNVRFLIGGTLSRETGAGLLIESINQMRLAEDPWVRSVVIEVTGSGSALDDFRFLASLGGYPRILVHGRLSNRDYQDVLNRADVGLSLKLNDGRFANTTFPSKVVEYGAAGLLILTTDISDVRVIFQSGAIYLNSNNSVELTNYIKDIVTNREDALARSRIGVRVIRSNFLPKIVGKKLFDFIFG